MVCKRRNQPKRPRQSRFGELLQTTADQDVPDAVVKAVDAETDGNPSFIREVLLHLDRGRDDLSPG
jgi:hypothetical protein